MPGIYIHIPFCKQACHYCDFHFSVSQKRKDEMIMSLHREIHLQKDFFSKAGEAEGSVIQTIYFGGGTPSVLRGDEIKLMLEEINREFRMDKDAEITLEANPDDLDKTTLEAMKNAGVNRLSIGIQSFYDEDLKWMNRAHDANQALSSVKEAQDAGFSNITIDLIYGTPILTDERWEKNLEQAMALRVPHLSCYALTVEPHTALAKFIIEKKVNEPDDRRTTIQFDMLMDAAERNGYAHYEISNFAKDKKYSRHNSSYWKGEKYLGIGPSAHSYDGISRQWNVRKNSTYMESIEAGRIPFEREVLTDKNKFNEYVMVSLRTMWGCDAEIIRSRFGDEAAENFVLGAQRYCEEGLLLKNGNVYTLTRKGKHFADRIASELFL